MSCPLCDSEELIFLGQLGNRLHYRCRHCGMDFSVQAREEFSIPICEDEEGD